MTEGFYEILMTNTDAALSLAAIVRRPAWMELAACRGRDDIDWQDPEPGPEALAICRGCPVLTDCTLWALDRQEIGTWAGMSERARLGRRHGHAVPRSCS